MREKEKQLKNQEQNRSTITSKCEILHTIKIASAKNEKKNRFIIIK